MNLRCFLAQLLGELVNLHGILTRLFAELANDQLIFFAMGDGRNRVRVGREVVDSAARSCGLCDMILLLVTVRLSHLSSLRLAHFSTFRGQRFMQHGRYHSDTLRERRPPAPGGS